MTRYLVFFNVIIVLPVIARNRGKHIMGWWDFVGMNLLK